MMLNYSDVLEGKKPTFSYQKIVIVGNKTSARPSRSALAEWGKSCSHLCLSEEEASPFHRCSASAFCVWLRCLHSGLCISTKAGNKTYRSPRLLSSPRRAGCCWCCRFRVCVGFLLVGVTICTGKGSGPLSCICGRTMAYSQRRRSRRRRMMTR